MRKVLGDLVADVRARGDQAVRDANARVGGGRADGRLVLSRDNLLEARDAHLLEGAVVDGRVIQPLQLVMPDDTVVVALYTMERQRGGAWRVAACMIAPSTLRAT